jgi:site-specific DNA-cytosine methylase
MSLLELFKGTGSVGKVAKKLGYKVTSLDFEEKFHPDIQTDILKWNYKDFPAPDFIWASPPCNTFSPLAYIWNERDTETAVPFSPRAKLGTKILYKTLEIISYFLKKNPHMKFCIENPVGMMRKDKKMMKLNRESTYYCHYGDKRRKHTDFWSNFPLDLNQKPPKEQFVPVANLPLEERYRIPSRLIKHILVQGTLGV